MSDDPVELVELAAKMEKPQEYYLKFKAVVDRYDRGMKSKLAELMMRWEGTVANREMVALASEEWKEYLKEWDSAAQNMVKAQVTFDNLQCRFNALQSKLSFLRESLKRL